MVHQTWQLSVWFDRIKGHCLSLLFDEVNRLGGNSGHSLLFDTAPFLPTAQKQGRLH